MPNSSELTIWKGGLEPFQKCLISGQLKVLFLEPFARSEPEKSNPASQGKDDVQKT